MQAISIPTDGLTLNGTNGGASGTSNQPVFGTSTKDILASQHATATKNLLAIACPIAVLFNCATPPTAIALRLAVVQNGDILWNDEEVNLPVFIQATGLQGASFAFKADFNQPPTIDMSEPLYLKMAAQANQTFTQATGYICLDPSHNNLINQAGGDPGYIFLSS